MFVLDTQTISLQNKQSILLFPEVTVFSRVSVLKSRDFPSCCLNWRGRSTCALIYWQFTLRLLAYQDVHDQPIFDIPPSVGFRTHLKVPKLSSWWPLKKTLPYRMCFCFCTCICHLTAISLSEQLLSVFLNVVRLPVVNKPFIAPSLSTRLVSKLKVYSSTPCSIDWKNIKYQVSEKD